MIPINTDIPTSISNEFSKICKIEGTKKKVAIAAMLNFWTHLNPEERIEIIRKYNKTTESTESTVQQTVTSNTL